MSDCSLEVNRSNGHSAWNNESQAYIPFHPPGGIAELWVVFSVLKLYFSQVLSECEGHVAQSELQDVTKRAESCCREVRHELYHRPGSLMNANLKLGLTYGNHYSVLCKTATWTGQMSHSQPPGNKAFESQTGLSAFPFPLWLNRCLHLSVSDFLISTGVSCPWIGLCK